MVDFAKNVEPDQGYIIISCATKRVNLIVDLFASKNESQNLKNCCLGANPMSDNL